MDDLVLKSLLSVSRTIPEPIEDLTAQLRAVCDPAHPKRSMFIAAGTKQRPIIPQGVYVAMREAGVLISADIVPAVVFLHARPLTDIVMALVLGYPQPKSDVMNHGDGVVMQATDADGNVITECVVTPDYVEKASMVLGSHVIPGGRLLKLHPADVLARRIARISHGHV